MIQYLHGYHVKIGCHCICECTSKYANNDEYFTFLYESLEDKQAINHMFMFFKNHIIKSFNPRIIPKTNAKEEMLDILKSPVEQYINSTSRDFNDTEENTASYYQCYLQLAASHGCGILNFNKFGKENKTYLTKERVRINGELENIFFLIEDYKQKILNDNAVDIDFDAINNVPI